MTGAASPDETAGLRPVVPFHLFRRGHRARLDKDEPDADTGREASTGSDRELLCATCGHRITRDEERISVADSHQHRFFNPAGFLFQIGCFGSAPGCLVVGKPSTEFTWFSGFAWRHALCEGCGEHLGWHFQNDDGNVFFGLVLNRLIESEDSRQ